MHNHNQPMCINKYPQGTFTSLVVDNCKLKSPQNRPMISVAKVRENVLEAKKANSMQTTQNLSTCSVQDKVTIIILGDKNVNLNNYYRKLSG